MSQNNLANGERSRKIEADDGQVEGESKGDHVSLEESEDPERSSNASSSESEPVVKWVAWFCSLKGNEFFCEIDEDYIRDNFNLTGLNLMVENYELALDAILDENAIEIDNLPPDKQEIVEDNAITLYGLIHSRYIITGVGLQKMHDKFQNKEFGRCPRIYCRGQPVLPIGISDIPRTYPTSVFCPRCRDLYFPKSTRQAAIDGAYIGTTFPHLFLLTYPELIPKSGDKSDKFVPRIFGFRINDESPYFQLSQIAEKEGDSYQSQVKALPTSPDVDEVKKDSKDI